MGVGIALAVVPMMVGGVMATSDDGGQRRAGIYVLQAGLALSPLFSHAIVREPGRGLLFALPGLLALGGVIAIQAADPDVTSWGEPASRVPFGILLCVSVVGAGLGLADTFFAPERWRKSHKVQVAPFAARGAGGLVIGGLF
jgi:hypothetical protein